jgi:formylglycine-generating enzyme required for sulfatase activity
LNRQLRINDDSGSRELAAGDLPLALAASPTGGLHLASLDDIDHPLLLIDWKDDGLWLLPGENATPARVNQVALDQPRQLEDGDVIEAASGLITVRIDSQQVQLDLRRQQDAQLIKPAAFRPGQAASAGLASKLSPGKLALAAAFIVLCLAVWFLLTARSVEIVSDPQAETTVITSGGFNLELGGRFLLRPGNYTVQLTRPGYHELNQDLVVSTKQDQEFQFSLEKLPGVLSVHSIPEHGATVFLDGAEVGTTPLTELDVAAGQYTLRIEAPRYQSVQQDLEIQGMTIAQSLELTMSPDWAEVTVSSTPPGAEILVDGELLASTPATVDILSGPHDLTLSLPGHKSWTEHLEISAGEPVNLDNVELVSADGLVQIRSKPAGARVTVNGGYRGQTPLELALAPGKTYRLRLGKAGFQTVTKSITVESGKDARLNVELPEFLGEVRVLSNPGNATVYANGRALGPTGNVFALPALPQRLEVRKPGYAPYVLTVTPRPGFAQEVEAVLQTLEQSRVASIPRIINSSSGHDLRLLQPGRFGMGSSRREQGRRSNESLRQVEITRRYYLSTREVSNAQFREFKGEHRSESFKDVDLNRDDYPVSGVSWADAVEYCNWLSKRDGLPQAYTRKADSWELVKPTNLGYRLPTEAEWTWAARYQGGVAAIKFPWGDSMPPNSGAGNFADITSRKILSLYLEDYNDGYAAAAPVAKFTANAMGMHDLGGNVAEWMHDYYQTYPGASRNVVSDPEGPASGEMHVIRGSSWRHGSMSELRFAYRDFDKDARPDLGFRVARFAE